MCSSTAVLPAGRAPAILACRQSRCSQRLWTVEASFDLQATMPTATCSSELVHYDYWPAFPLVIGLVEPPAGIEPATPSLPWNHQEPLCGLPFAQVTPDRRGQSYRFSFSESMRSLQTRC